MRDLSSKPHSGEYFSFMNEEIFPNRASLRWRRWVSPKRIVRFGTALLLLGLLLWGWTHWDPDAFESWRADAGPVPFFIALAILPCFGVPTTPFYILAGATFSPWINFWGITLSLALNVLLTYVIVRSFLRKGIEWLLRSAGYAIPKFAPKKALRFCILLKLAPGVPQFVKNYLIGLSGIPFGHFFLICFGITIWYAFAFVMLGDSIYDRDPAMALAALAVVGIVALVLFLLWRHLGKDKAIAQAAALDPTAEDHDSRQI